jgi:hypothetical protein
MAVDSKNQEIAFTRRAWSGFQACNLSILGADGLAICNFLAGVLYNFDYGKKGVFKWRRKNWFLQRKRKNRSLLEEK